MEIVTMGLAAVQGYVPGDDEACISIHFADHSCMAVLPVGFSDVLRVGFDDCTPDRSGLSNSAVQITREQAIAMAKFAEVNAARKKLVVHCFAGVSRSVSVAMALRGDAPPAPNQPVYEAMRAAMDWIDAR